jgi:hypothetical protein
MFQLGIGRPLHKLEVITQLHEGKKTLSSAAAELFRAYIYCALSHICKGILVAALKMLLAFETARQHEYQEIAKGD